VRGVSLPRSVPHRTTRKVVLMQIPVGPAFPDSLATLDEVKGRLNIKPAADDGSDDDELELYLGSATVVLQNLYGDIIPTSYTETLRPYGGGTHLLTGRSPLLSVGSITVSWDFQSSPVITLSPLTYKVILATGEIRIYAGTSPFAWQYPQRDWAHAEYDVTYTAGRATVTDNVKDAVLEILRINWAPQRGGNLPGVAVGDPENGLTYMGFYIPNGAHERLAGGERPRQIA
jgi:hypothetical protein